MSASPAARLVQEIEAKAKPNTFSEGQRRFLLDGIAGFLTQRPPEAVSQAVAETFSSPSPPRVPRLIVERISERLAAVPPGPEEAAKPPVDPNAELKQTLSRFEVPSYFLRGTRERILKNAWTYAEDYHRDFTPEECRHRDELKNLIVKEWNRTPPEPEQGTKENA